MLEMECIILHAESRLGIHRKRNMQLKLHHVCLRQAHFLFAVKTVKLNSNFKNAGPSTTGGRAPSTILTENPVLMFFRLLIQH